MRNIAFLILIFLLIFIACEQEKRPEEQIFNCFKNAYSEHGVDLEKEMQYYEDYLIENQILNKRDAKSYYKLFMEIQNEPELNYSVEYSFIDSILPEFEEMQDTNNFIECIQLMHSILSDEKYKESKFVRINKMVDTIPAFHMAFNILESIDFKLKYYQFVTLMSITVNLDTDIGLQRKLPPIKEKDHEPIEINRRNVLIVLINEHDSIFINNQLTSAEDIKRKVKGFVKNAENLSNLSDKEFLSTLKQKAVQANDPDLVEKYNHAIVVLGDYERSKGVVSLQNDKGTSYAIYIQVQTEIVSAFKELRDELSIKKFGILFDELDENKQTAIKTAIPQAISEAEPS